jgi:hypothetical protein
MVNIVRKDVCPECGMGITRDRERKLEPCPNPDCDTILKIPSAGKLRQNIKMATLSKDGLETKMTKRDYCNLLEGAKGIIERLRVIGGQDYETKGGVVYG